jgi:hypothetical protein
MLRSNTAGRCIGARMVLRQRMIPGSNTLRLVTMTGSYTREGKPGCDMQAEVDCQVDQGTVPVCNHTSCLKGPSELKLLS